MHQKIFGVSHDVKRIVTHMPHDNGDMILWDGIEKYCVPYLAFREERKNYHTSPLKFIPCHNGNLEETLTEFLRDAERLKKETNGVINLWKSGTISQTALSLFFNLCPIVPDTITIDESTWISEATVGAIIFAEPYNGPAWKYDICSMYASIMQDVHMLFPFKTGGFETLTKFDKDYPVAIYRCKIEKKPGLEKLFRYNCKNKYTTIDVRRARLLNLDIQLIQDGKPNVLIWDRSRCKTGSQIFRAFVNFMFPLKQKKIPRAPEILKALWGALCEERVYKRTVGLDGFPKDDNLTMIKMTPYGEDKMALEFTYNNKRFEYNWARIKPFLLAKGRAIISKLIEPHAEFIVRSHTDSMFSTKPLEVKTGTGLGELRYEGYCENYKLVHSTKFSGQFKL